VRLIEQSEFPLLRTPFNPGRPDLTGYVPPPSRARKGEPAEWPPADGVPLVTVVGTVRDQLVAFERSWAVWARQRPTPGATVEYLVLDDGSSDGVRDRVLGLQDAGHPVAWASYRGPAVPGERSCTLLFNSAVRQGLVRSPLVMFQWWDRIPGSFRHLDLLLRPHRHAVGLVTSAVSRHVGGSSSVESMRPEELAAVLDLVDWRSDPTRLARVAGPIGGHCRPGLSSESSGFVMRVDEFVALGGYDERYTARHGYVNVELWRRILESGQRVLVVPEPHGANYHQSHPTDRRKPGYGHLGDRLVCRNRGVDWGRLEPVDHEPVPRRER